MAELDFSHFLNDQSVDQPCGENLEYDPLFQEIEQDSEGEPERRVGDSVIPAVEPDWKSVYKKSLQLLERTRDIQVAVYLTRALIHTNRLEGLWQGVALVKGLLEHFWECVYPIQDPDDDYPVLRINVLANLNDHDTFLNPIKNIPLTDSNVMGKFSLRDVELATGKLSVSDEESESPKSSEIDAAFMDSDLHELEKKNENVESILAEIHAITEITKEHVGTVNAPDFSDLVALLRQMNSLLNEQIIKCGGSASTTENGQPLSNTGDAVVSDATAALSGINSREDVKRALEAICDYYDRHEPSSPIPFMLKRVERLLFKDFRELLQDIAPDGISQAEILFGDMAEEES